MNAKPDELDLTGEDDPRLLRAAQEYLAELEAGRRPDRGEFVGRFPEIAAELGPYLDTLDLFQSAAPLVCPSGRPPVADESLPAEPLGDFRIVRQIGRGGMGVVYEAVQLSLGRRVALKVLPFATALDSKQLQRFKHEAQAAAQLHHTNIVPVYFVGCERGVHYYAMQLIEGQNLAELIRQLRPQEPGAEPGRPGHAAAALPLTAPFAERPSGRDPAAEASSPATAHSIAAELSTQRATRAGGFYRAAARLAIQAAEALEHAHQLGVIHRDVKPANLMVDAHGNVWVTDFGLAQFHAGAALTRTGDLLGTLRYMSPEQAGGQGVPLDARTDVYSLGATLYELLTLEPMFAGEDHRGLLRQILNDEPRPPRALDPSVPRELETIVLKAVSKNPAERYGTAQEFAEGLRRFLEDRPILARRPTLPQRARKWVRRHPSFVVAAVVLLVLVAVGSMISAALVRAAYKREQQRANDADYQFQLAQAAVNEMIDVSEEDLADNPFLEGVRQRLLESALGYYQQFIDRSRDNPAKQEELQKAKDRVEKILADLATIQGAGRQHLLDQEKVRDALTLSDEQERKLKQLSDGLHARARQMFDQFGRLSPDERQQQFLAQAREEDAAVSAVLTPKQVQRLRQIALQLRGVAAFRTPEVVTALKLTTEQRKRIRAIESDAWFRPPKGKRQRGPREGEEVRRKDDETRRKEHAQRQKAAMTSALAVLTPEQKQSWREMIGDRFDGAVPFMLPGRPGPPPPEPEPGRRPPPGPDPAQRVPDRDVKS